MAATALLSATGAGWEGRRGWSSLEGQLTIRVEYAGGRVQFYFDVRNMGWAVVAQVLLGAGEDLSNVARTAERWLR